MNCLSLAILFEKWFLRLRIIGFDLYLASSRALLEAEFKEPLLLPLLKMRPKLMQQALDDLTRLLSATDSASYPSLTEGDPGSTGMALSASLSSGPPTRAISLLFRDSPVSRGGSDLPRFLPVQHCILFKSEVIIN